MTCRRAPAASGGASASAEGNGVILDIAVLLDAMLVRLVLMPTLLRVFGRWAWARPRRLGRVLPDVRFGHA